MRKIVFSGLARKILSRVLVYGLNHFFRRLARNNHEKYHEYFQRMQVKIAQCGHDGDNSSGQRHSFLSAFSGVRLRKDTFRWYLDWFCGLDPLSAKRALRTLADILILGLKRRADNTRHRNDPAWPADFRYMILAQSGPCNLDCRGCYTNGARGHTNAGQDRLEYIVSEADSLNAAMTVLTGRGEPFYGENKHRVFGLARRFPHMIFAVFTNGTMIGREEVMEIRKTPNIMPVVSVDGFEALNDDRRGRGVFKRAEQACRRLGENNIFYGFSPTVHRGNWQEVASYGFAAHMMSLGAKFGIYFSFIHVPGGGNDGAGMAMTAGDVKAYGDLLSGTSLKLPIPLLDSDVSETMLKGGCLARQGKLVYVEAGTGKVAPCVKTPFSGPSCGLYADARPGRLREILNGPFFRQYRAGMTGHFQCGQDYCRELDYFLSQESLDDGERERILGMKAAAACGN